MNLKGCLLVIGLIAISVSASAQSDSSVFSHNASALTDYFTNHPVEKVYLHLDKQDYIPGDTIWFKAYTVAGQTHQLSALSGVLYCELINNKDSVVSRHILKLLVGLGWGDFDLPRALKPGNYRIRAYTNWMRNAGPEYFYDQKISIGGMLTAIAPVNQLADLKPDVQFFPEGGQMVNGLRSKIAVKCISAGGLGQNVTGIITDNDGNEVAQFATQHLGMGIFALTPQAGKTYTAKITADSLKYSFSLPVAQDKGFTLAVNSSNADSIYLHVVANDKYFKANQNTAFYIMAQSGGKVFYTARGKLDLPAFAASIPKERFPQGIVQFTLFSQSGQPLNERIIFIQNNDDDLKFALTSPAKTYTTRQKVNIKLNIQGGATQLPIGSFSVSVTNESRLPVNGNTEPTIFSSLLLTSDIKGNVEQPNYYFNQINDQSRADLDVLMLTQGYRRFEWKKVLADSIEPIAYAPEKSLELAGIIKTPSGKAVPGGGIVLTSTREGYFKDTTTDVNGNFKFTGLNLTDTAKVVLRAKKANKGTNVVVYVKKPDYPLVIRRNLNDADTAINLTPEMLKNIREYKRGLHDDSIKNVRNLKQVEIRERRLSKPDIYNSYGSKFEYDADMKKLNREFLTLGEAIPSIIPGANYVDGRGITYDHERAGLIIDGLRHQTSDINLYSPREIDNVRMIDPPAMLVVTTKRYAGTDTASTQLKEVNVIAKKTRKEPDLSQSQSLHPGAADQVIMGDKLGVGCANISDCLVGRVFGVNFASDGTPQNVRAKNATMSLIVDGNIIDGSQLNTIVNARDVYSIEVLKSVAARSVYGNSIQAGGALVITLKHGGEPNTMITSVDPSGLITYPFKGYSVARTFYSPKYDGPRTEGQSADLRSTIYWNPNVITDKNGKASFEYYNADSKGIYRVVVEGIDDNGNIGRQVLRYKVE